MSRADDDVEIRNLLARVARLTDQWTSEAELIAEYTEDCVWDLEGIEPYRGHEGIARRMREMRDAGVCGPGATMRHIVSTPEVTFDPADPARATAIAFVMMGEMQDGKPILRGYGQYTDSLRKVAGRWYLSYRKGVAFW